MSLSYQELQFPPLERFAPPKAAVATLSNGTKVFFLEDHELPLVSLDAFVRAGTIYEPAAKAGLAWLTGETMHTGGSARFPGDEADEIVAALGGDLAISIGSASGSGSVESTSDKFPQLVEMLSDHWFYPIFPEEKMELGKTAMRSAIARRNDQVTQVSQRAFQIAMYGASSPLAREPEYKTVDAISREDLVAFHRSLLGVDRMILGVVGDFSTKEALELLERGFGSAPRSVNPPAPGSTEPLRASARAVTFAQKSDVNQSSIRIGGIGIRRDHPDWPALRLGSSVLGTGGFSSRLRKRIRTELGLAYSVGGGFSAEYDRVGLFQCVCQTKSESTVLATELMFEEIERMLAAPPTVEELKLAREQILNAEVFEYDSSSRILSRRLTLDYYGYPETFLETFMARIATVTPAEVLEAFRRHLDPSKLQIVIVGNEAQFDKPLSTLGPVTMLDLSIPHP